MSNTIGAHIASSKCTVVFVPIMYCYISVVPIQSISCLLTESASCLSATESLPTNYARNFPHWVAQGGELIRIPKPDSDEGFVEPSSFSEVWLPVDLPSPEARLGLCFVLKDGAPR